MKKVTPTEDEISRDSFGSQPSCSISSTSAACDAMLRLWASLLNHLEKAKSKRARSLCHEVISQLVTRKEFTVISMKSPADTKDGVADYKLYLRSM